MNENENEEEKITKEITNITLEKIEPIIVKYCGVCGTPVEYCEYGSSYDKCKVWLKENCPELVKEKEEEEEKEENENENKEIKASKRGGKGLNKPIQDDNGEKKLPGGKDNFIIIKNQSRTKTKSLTSITGLEKFNLNLQDMCKIFKKKFSCGASIIKANGTGEEEIIIQGDVLNNLTNLLIEQYNIPENVIKIIEDKKKGK